VFLFCLSSSCVLCTRCCLCLWIVHSSLPHRFSLAFINNINNIDVQKLTKQWIKKMTTWSFKIIYWELCCELDVKRTFDNISLTSLRSVLIVILNGLNGISKNYIENQNAVNHIFLFIFKLCI
jgi:hypothetical protein